MFAQNDKTFEKLNIEKGDLQSIVYSVCYDEFGNAWFATEDGLVRYNSKEAYFYNTYEGLPEGIGNRVFKVFNDSDNNLWIGTEKGLAKFNFNKNIFEEINDAKSKISKVNYIFEDTNKNIWIATNNGLWKIHKNKNKNEINSKQFLENYIISGITESDTKIIISTNKGLYTFRNDANTILETNLHLVSKNIKTASAIKKIQDNIYLGTKEGQLFKFNSELSNQQQIHFSEKQKGLTIRDIEFNTDRFTIAIDGEGLMILDENFNLVNHYYNDENNPKSISSNGVYDVYFGNDGIIWYATYGGGVNFRAPSKEIFKTFNHQINNKNSLDYNITRAILQVDQTIWFGTKKGISIYDLTSKKWKHLTNFPNTTAYSEEVILSLVRDGEYIWAGSYYHGLYRISIKSNKIETFNSIYPNQKINLNKIFKVFIDTDHDLWIGGIDGKLTQVTKEKVVEYKIQDIRDITQKSSNEIIAVGKEGVFIVNKLNERFSKIALLNPNKETLHYNTINCVLVEKDYLVLGTNGNGLVFYNWETKKINRLNSSNKINSNIIQGILKTDNEYWISTSKGISQIKFDSNDTIVKNFNKTDGLSSNEFNYGAYEKLADGNLVFGGIDGVTMFHPDHLKNRNVIPNLFFEEFYIDNQIVTDSKILKNHINELSSIQLQYNQNSFGLKFVGILQGYANKVKYIYKLEGFDKNWSEPSTKNQINYTNLSSGKYTLKVKASDELGKFASEKAIVIVISSPWYASFWAYIIYGVLIIAMIFGLVYLIKIFEIQKNKEEQIEFFNNITHEIKTPLAILLTTLEDKNNDENVRVKSNIERINALINQMLNFQKFSINNAPAIQVAKINLNDFITNIINDFKPLLEQKELTIEIQNNCIKELFYYDEDYLNKILFNLISNAIKYSFEKNKIIVTIDSNDKNSLLIKVKDFGIGIPKSAQKNILTKFFRAKNVMNNQFSGTGLGLMIVKNIVENSRGKITFKSSLNKGTIFKVVLPSFEKQYSESVIQTKELSEIEVSNEIHKYTDKKVLVVEDNDDLREYLVKTLENYFLVYEAKNGKEGLEFAHNIFPDLILTDFMMPIMDGLEMCIKIKEDINLNHIPIFMLTALHNTIHKKESTEIGVTEYIEKPINISFLLAKIISVFSWQENLREHYKHQTDINIAGKNKVTKENEFLIKLESIILDKIKDESFSLQDICDNIGMSRTSLYMKLKNLIDLSPQDFIIHVKLKHAKKLLIEGDSNIKEVAYASGFSNPKYFSTSFKKVFGLSPSEFVKNLK
ncbi:MAG: hypothetical protein CMP76_14430 [Flavobacterium sp.]|nr:hypothetical protein [Flavobacterium sp.]